MVGIGFVLLLTGLLRIVPLTIDRRFWIQNGPLMLMLAIIFALVGCFGEKKDFVQWGSRSLIFWSSFMPLLVLLFVVMAGGGVITTLFGKEIQGFLERHHVLTPLIGSLIAPTTNSVSAIVEKAWEIVSLRPMLVFFLQASAMMSIPLFNMRALGYVNSEVSAKMYLSGLVLSSMAFVFNRQIYWLVDLMYQRWWK